MDTSKSLIKREVATVKLWLLLPSLLCHVHTEREVIVSVEGALSVIDGKRDHLSLMLNHTQLRNRRDLCQKWYSRSALGCAAMVHQHAFELLDPIFDDTFLMN